MGDRTVVGPSAEEVTSTVADQLQNTAGVNSSTEEQAVAGAEQSMAQAGGKSNESNRNGSGENGIEAISCKGAENGVGHPVPDNLNITGNGVTQVNDGVGIGGNGNNGEGDNFADDVGTTDDEAGRAPIDTACSEGGPSSLVGIVGPPSPLTGCYLLIILGEPHSDEHKDHILQNLLKGFLSWDVSDCHVDLEGELNTITQSAPEGEEARHGERLIQYASENLVTEVLIHPQYNTLIQCMRNLLSSFTRHRHVIHAGYTFTGNGSWILQDGTFSVADFSEAFQEHDVQRVLRAYPDTITMNIHCADNGLWNILPDKAFARLCKIRINPNDVLDTSNASINAFIDYLAPMLTPTSLSQLLETTDVVGNIRFTHPTLYVFPGGQGDAALFGINGFNMLVDGGFNRKACFWDFARHLDRLDAVLLTRLNNSNINGMAAVVERKRDSHVYPQIGHFFCNIPDRKGLPSPDGDKDKDPLLVDLFERGHSLVSDLKSLDLKPQTCYRNSEPINLYHKVGHGTLDMYVISPSKDSKEVREFLQKWNAGDQRLFAAKDTREFNFPIQNLVSICALLVWQPADPEDTITRILFPGSTPDYKIQEGLEKLKHLEFMKYSTCTAKSIAPVIQTVPTRRAFKSGPLEKGFAEPVLPSKVGKAFPTERDINAIEARVKSTVQQQQDNKMKEISLEATSERKFEKNIDKVEDVTAAEIIEQVIKDTEKESEITSNGKLIISKDDEKKDEEDNKEVVEKKVEVMIVKPQPQQPEIESTPKDDIPEIIKPKSKPKTEKPRAEVKPVVRSRIDTKPPKSMDKKALRKDDRKSSPTPISKKQDVQSRSLSVKDREIKPKVISRAAKSSPSSTPAKSAKDANNRKVVESKQHISKITISRKEIVKSGTKTERKETKKMERKPISRRPRGASPSKRAPGSPVKLPKPRTDLKKSRLDKGGTTDSSLVSTPSADEGTTAKKLQDMVISQELDAAKQRELDDLKEEQEVVREIEAVFSRDEKKRLGELKADRRGIDKQDSTTEAEEDEEYLIIEKEEIEQYTEDSIIEQESSMTKEEEIQKHQRDSQESEKKRKRSAEEEIEAEIAKAEAEERRSRQQIETDQEATEEDADIQPDSIEDKVVLTTPEKSELKAEVQEIISSAKEIVKARVEETVIKTEELSSPSREDKISSAKKTSDTKDELVEEQDMGKDVNLQESLPEEKFSATIESGATTAPTLPEDERIPLDEIKEDIGIEEKHVKEKTKEVDVLESLPKPHPISEALTQVAERVFPMKMTFESQQNLLRDIVKTPDEVADLPVHEEVDFEVYDEKERHDVSKQLSLKEEIAKEEKEIEEKYDVSKDVVKPEETLISDVEKPITPRAQIHTDVEKAEKIEVAKRKGDLLEIVQPKTIGEVQQTEQATVDKVDVERQTDLVEGKSLHKTLQKRSTTSPEDKEQSEFTSDDEPPEQFTAIRGKVTELKDKEDTTSLESPATIEEAIEVEIGKPSTRGQQPITKSLMEELRMEQELRQIKTHTQTIEEEKPIIESFASEKLVADFDEPEKMAHSLVDKKDEKLLKEMKVPEKEVCLSTYQTDMKLISPTKEFSQTESPVSIPEEKKQSESESLSDGLKADMKIPGEKMTSTTTEKDAKSVTVGADDKERLQLKDVPQEPKETDPKLTSPSKESSQPQIVASDVGDKEHSQKKSIDKVSPEKVSPVVSKPDAKLTSISKGSFQSELVELVVELPKAEVRTTGDNVSPAASEKDIKSVSHFEEPSRPESVGSADDKEQLRQESLAEVSEPMAEVKPSEEKVPPAASEKDAKSLPPSRESSRPESVASVDDKEQLRKESLAEVSKAEVKLHEEKVSPAASEKDAKSLPPSKESSRPESVTSAVDDKEQLRKESLVEILKADVKSSEETVSPAATEKDIKSGSPSEEPSLPESVGDADDKEQLRKESLAEVSKTDVKPSEEKVSPAASEKDTKSLPPSKESSRRESVTSAVDDKEQLRKESLVEISKAEVKSSEETVSPAASEKDIKSGSPSEEPSLPESVGGADYKEQLRKESLAEASKTDVKPSEEKASPAAGEKAGSPSEEPSRPESVDSAADVKKKSRNESFAEVSKTDLKSVEERVFTETGEKDAKSSPPFKAPFRPESVASVDDKEQLRKESLVEVPKTDIKASEEKVAPAASEKDAKSLPPSKESSRPESVASVDDREHLRKDSLAEVSKTDVKPSAEKLSPVNSEKDAKSLSPSKESSRPKSVTSAVDDKELLRKESLAKVPKTDVKPTEEKVSPAASEKDAKSLPASEESYRPESVTCVDDREQLRKESLAEVSETDVKPSEETVSQAASEKDVKSLPKSKESSRPESVASVDGKEQLRKESLVEVSKTDVKPSEEKLSPAASEKDAKSLPPSKESSRPESVASVDGKEQLAELSKAEVKSSEEKVSQAASEKDAKSLPPSKESSRPESVASDDGKEQLRRESLVEVSKTDVKPSEEKVSPAASEKEAKSLPPSKESSRPESVASVDDREQLRKESLVEVSKTDEKPSEEKLSPAASEKDAKSLPPSKESSRPESVASVDGKEQLVEVSKADVKPSDEKLSPAASEIDAKSLPPSKASSLPESVASVDGKEQLAEVSKAEVKSSEEKVSQAASEKGAKSLPPSKESSRPESVASVDGKEQLRKESLVGVLKTDVKPSEEKVSPAASEKDAKSLPPSKESSRPESVASVDGKEQLVEVSKADVKPSEEKLSPAASEKDAKSLPPSKESSRPESVASVDGKERLAEVSKAEVKSSEEKVSQAASEKDAKSLPPSKESSRPESVASVDGKEQLRKESLVEVSKADVKPSEEKVSPAASEKEAKSLPPSKESSRPESVASVDGKEQLRKESLVEVSKTDVKPSEEKVSPAASEKEAKSLPPSKESSQPESVASVDDTEQLRKESLTEVPKIDVKPSEEKVSPTASEKDAKSRPESVASVDFEEQLRKDILVEVSKTDEKPSEEKLSPAASEKDAKSLPPSKESSRPESVASVDGKEQLRKESLVEVSKTDVKPSEEKVSPAASEKEAKSLPPSKESSQPESVASVDDTEQLRKESLTEVPKIDVKPSEEKVSPTASEKAIKSGSPSEEPSRPESIASGDGKEQLRKESLTKVSKIDVKSSEEKVSPAASEKDAKSLPPSKESSRSVSVASVDGKEQLRKESLTEVSKIHVKPSEEKVSPAASEKDAKSMPPSKESSRSESVASVDGKEQLRKESLTEVSKIHVKPSEEKVSPAASEKDAKSLPPSKESSRPESVASVDGEEQLAEVSKAEVKSSEEKVSQAAIEKDAKSLPPSKGSSRPESVASVDGKEQLRKESLTEVSKIHVKPSEEKVSPAASEKDAKSLPPSKESSRPESVASVDGEEQLAEVSKAEVKSSEEKVSQAAIEKDAKSLPPSKGSSGPESVASVDGKEQLRKESLTEVSKIHVKPSEERVSPAASEKEAKSLPPSKESSRSESVASVDDKEQLRIGSLTEVPKTDVKPSEEKVSPAASEKDAKSLPPCKETSRPESLASHDDKEQLRKESGSPSEEPSRPASVTSVDGKEQLRKESLTKVSIIDVKSSEQQVSPAASEKDVMSLPPSKESSRPESVASVDDKEQLRKESLTEVSKIVGKPSEEKVCPAASEKDGKSLPPSKESSRPESVASVDDKEQLRKESLAEVSKVEVKLHEEKVSPAASEKDAKSLPPSKESSRPESVASVDDKEQLRKESLTEVSKIVGKPSEEKVSPAASEKDGKSLPPSKESSRPESVASVDDKEQLRKESLTEVSKIDVKPSKEKVSPAASEKDAKSLPPSKESSRPESVASVDGKEQLRRESLVEVSKTDVKPSEEKVSSTASEKATKSGSPSEAPSRPESVASVDGKEQLRKESLVEVSKTDVKPSEEKLSPAASEKDAKSLPPSKESSRPESVASVDGKEQLQTESLVEVSKTGVKPSEEKLSPAASEKDAKSLPPSKESSRPESVASVDGKEQLRKESLTEVSKNDVKPSEEKVSPAASEKDAKSLSPSKESSQPESVASVDDKEQLRKESLTEVSKIDGKLSEEKVSPAASEKDGKSLPPSEESSRPESVASVDDKEQLRKESLTEVSKIDVKPSEEKVSSAASEKDAKSLPPSKESSQPESVASVDDKEQLRKESLTEVSKIDGKPSEEKVSPAASEKDAKSLPPSKESSRPESVASVDGKEQLQKESLVEVSKTDVKPSEEKVSPTASEKAIKSGSPSEAPSRPESVASVDGKEQLRKESLVEVSKTDVKPSEEKLSPAASEKDAKSLPPSKESSRPESVASVDGKEQLQKESLVEVSKTDVKPSEEKLSPAASEKDAKSLPPSKESSRPESVASVDGKEQLRKESLVEISKTDIKPSEEKLSPAASGKDAKSLPPSKESSRPESVASVDGKEQLRKESLTEVSKIHVKPSEEKVSPAASEKDAKSLPPSKESSRSESVASVDDKEQLRIGSLTEDPKTDVKPSEEKVSPAASEKDVKSLPPSKESSRPESVVSVEDREQLRKESLAEISKTDVKPFEEKISPAASEKDAKSRPVSVASVDDKEQLVEVSKAEVKSTEGKVSPAASEKDAKSLPPSKESSRPESVASADHKEQLVEVSKAEVKSTEGKVSPAASEKDAKSMPPSKESSRSESVASADDKEQLVEVSKAEVKSTEGKVSPAASEKDAKSLPPSKESSRPESIASMDDKESLVEVSKAEVKPFEEKVSPAVSEKDIKSRPPSEKSSRLESVAAVDDKEQLVEVSKAEVKSSGEKVPAAASEKDAKSLPPSKQSSRPESVVSIEDREQLRKESLAEISKTDVKPFEGKVSPAVSEKEAKSMPPSKESSRSESVASADDKEQLVEVSKAEVKSTEGKVSPAASEKDAKSLPPSKESSRPESIASMDDKESLVEVSKAEVKSSEEKVSQAASEKDIKSRPPSEKSSRLESVAAVDDKEQLVEVSKAEVKSSGEKVPAAASEKDAKSLPPSKQSSRPESVVSIEDREQLRKESLAEISKTDVKSFEEKVSPAVSEKDAKSMPPSKESSRPESVASVDDKEQLVEVSKAEVKDVSSLQSIATLESSSVVETDGAEHEFVSETVSSPIDKAQSAVEFSQISKLQKDTFKLDLKSQAEPNKPEVETSSSPVDVAQSEFIGQAYQKTDVDVMKSEIISTDTEQIFGEEARVLTETVSSPIDEVTPFEKDQHSICGESVEELLQNTVLSISEKTQMAVTEETVVEDEATTFKKDVTSKSEKAHNVIAETETAITTAISDTVKVAYDVKGFHTELRETHITTLDSPSREEIILHDIKEEDEEHRSSPPKEKDGKKIGITSTVPVSQLKRPVSPREEEVAKIVANVAQVLKSEKDITDIIPDFNEEELEKKLLKTKGDDEITVQRMLVTASSEDGGEEIEICPKGSIVFTPSSTPDVISGKVSPDLEPEPRLNEKIDSKSLQDSEKSSPDVKSGPISLEEKDKMELSEKMQMEKVYSESECQPDTIRRESAVSVLSEKDITRDESTYDEKPESVSSHELGKFSPEPTEQVRELIQESIEMASKIEMKTTDKSKKDFSKDTDDATKETLTKTIAETEKKISDSISGKFPTILDMRSNEIDKVTEQIAEDKISSQELSCSEKASSVETIAMPIRDDKSNIFTTKTTIASNLAGSKEKCFSESSESSSSRLIKQAEQKDSRIESVGQYTSERSLTDSISTLALTSSAREKQEFSEVDETDSQTLSYTKIEKESEAEKSSLLCSTKQVFSESSTSKSESYTMEESTKLKETKEKISSGSNEATIHIKSDKGLESTSSKSIIRSDSVSSKYEHSEKEESLSSAAVSMATKKIDSSESKEKIHATERISVFDQTAEMSTSIKDTLQKDSVSHSSSEARQTTSLSDHDEDEEDNADILKMKEARSKSIATIMMTSIYKPSDECKTFDILSEEESCEYIGEEKSSMKRSIVHDFEAVQQAPVQDSICMDGKHSDRIFASEEPDRKSPEEFIDRKTPPTAPVSPGIKASTTSEQKESAQQTSTTTMHYSETACSTSVPSSPKDISGKSSPGALTSESRSIPTPAGRESLTETPESSPKPTSPFPRVTKEDIQTITTLGTSDVIQTSTPDLSEIKALEKTSLSGSTEKIITTTITTVTKVISSDGKEIIMEEKTITTTDTSEPQGEKVTVTTTRTTSESDKLPLQPKELAMLRSEYRSSTPGSDDERPYSDDEVPPSPRSITSSQAASYELQRSSSGISKRSDIDIDDSQDDIPPQYGSEEHSSALSISMAHRVIDPMSTSFYGALPDSFGSLTTPSAAITETKKSEPIPIQTSRTVVSRTFGDSPASQSSESENASQTWALRHSGDHKFLDEADLDFEKALEEHRQLRGAEVMSSVTAKYSYSPSKSTIEETISETKFPLGTVQKTKSSDGSTVSSADDENKDLKQIKDTKDPTKDWGKPLGLPSPAPIPIENDVRTTPKKERRMMAAKTKLNNEKNLRKRSESPSKTKKSNPIYVDLTYVPHNGNSYYSHLEFFKKVRARYYVFSGIEPSREVYNALLEAKQTWEDRELEVTIIPTYDTDILGYWVAENEELLAKYHIDLSPSASRCTINLQDHETSCSAYRLEF